ncbi:MAG: hypothetical protein MRY57_02480 [Candidatus Pacebacteria bacterium]|nr:hypothetical protein [Candidatus Paceibacterota bacterium]
MKKARKIKLNFKPQNSSKKLLKGLKDRDRYVLESRFGLSEPKKKTLESIGQEYDITRERVRQIQDAALKAIRKSDSYDEAKEIFAEIEDLIHDLGGVVSEDHFLDSVHDDELIQNHIHFHLVVGDNFRKHKEDKKFRSRWAVNGELSEKVHTALEKLHGHVTEEELLSEEQMVLKFLDRLDGVEDGYVDDDVARQFLLLSKLIDKNPLGDWGLSESQNVSVRGIRDYAYLIMKKNGSPMHFREVAESITSTFDKKAHPATTHNELIKDDRFVLVGRGMYGLKEWGYRSGVVKDVIRDLIHERGPLTKEEIIEAVLKERYLKENTILVNLSNKDYFKKNDEGKYVLAEGAKAKLKAKSKKK